MATIEREKECVKCNWKGRNLVEDTKSQTPFQELTSLIAVALRADKCPECNAETTTHVKQMVS